MLRLMSRVSHRAVAAAALCAVLLIGGRPSAYAQKLTLTIPDGTPYEIAKVPGYTPTFDKKANTITARALVTLHFLRVPDGYTVVHRDTLPAILGRDLGGIDPAVIVPSQKPTERSAALRWELYHKIDDHIKTKQSYLLTRNAASDLQTDASGKLTKQPRMVSEIPSGDVKQDAVFPFADQHSNSSAARRLAWSGNLNISPTFNAANLGNLTLLTHPERGADPKAETVSLPSDKFIDRFRDYCRWSFSLVTVDIPAAVSADGSEHYPSMPNVPMVEVDASCVVQAVITPGQTINFPIVTTAFTAAPDGDGATNGANGTTTGGDGFASFLFGANTGSLFTPGNTPSAHPGLDFITGIGVQNNDTPTFVGVSAYVVPHEGDPEISPTFFNLQRLTAVVGKTQGDYAANVLAVGYRVHPSVTFFGGGAFNQANGSTRVGPIFGFAIRILDLISPKAATPATVVDVEIQNGKFLANPPLVTQTASILWTTTATAGAAAGSHPLNDFTFTVTGSAGDLPPLTINPVYNLNGAKHYQDFWLTAVQAGKIKAVQYGGQAYMVNDFTLLTGKTYKALVDTTAKTVTISDF